MTGPVRYLKREDAEVMARTVVERTASRGCVEAHGLSWTSPSLLEWEIRQREMGKEPKVDVRIDELNLGVVYVEVPERGVGPFKAWSRQPQFTEGLSISELNRLKRAVKDKDLADRLGRLADDDANKLRVEFYVQLGRGNDPAAMKRQAELQDELARRRLQAAGIEPPPEPPKPPKPSKAPKRAKQSVGAMATNAAKPSGQKRKHEEVTTPAATTAQPAVASVIPQGTPAVPPTDRKPKELPASKFRSAKLKRSPT